MKEGVWELDLVRFEFKDGVLRYVFKPINDSAYVDLSYAKKIVFFRQQITKGAKVPVLVDVTQMKGISKEAREYWATPNAIKDVLVGAIIISNPVTVAAANFYLLLNKPEVKSKLFRKKEEALKWLNTESTKILSD